MMQKTNWIARSTPYLVCFTAALFFAYELMQFHMMNAIAPMLIKDLGMNAASFGKLCASYLLADVIFLLPAGVILDYISSRKVILSALLFCIIGTTGFAFATTFSETCVCHFLSGIGNAFCFLSCMILVSKWFPPQKQAFVIGMVITIGMLGGVLAQSPFSLLAEALTWRKALLVDAIFGIFIYGLIYLIVKDGPLKSASSQGKVPFWTGLKKSVFNLQNICCGIYTCFMNMPLMVFSAVWGSLFLTQIHHIPLSKASFIVSMICIGTIVGSPLYGILSEKSQTKRPWMLLGGLLSLLFMLAILLIPSPSEPLLIALFFLLGLFSSSQVLGYPIITENNPKELTGTSMGIAAVIIMGLPMIVQPLSGYLLDLNWNKTLINGVPLYSLSNYLTAFSIFPIGFLLALLSLLPIKTKSIIQRITI